MKRNTFFMKKAIVFLLIFTIGSVLFAQQGLEYEVVDGKSVTITGYTGNATILNIPAQIQGLPVTAIGERAFQDSGLTNVTIPSSVTPIRRSAFLYCSSLTSITVDNRNPSYASIDGVLFDKNIRTLIIYPEGKTARTYTIPSSVTNIGENAFSYGNLTSVTIPSSVTSIGRGAFHSCSRLTSVTIPSSVTYIGDYAFIDSGLTSVTIPSSVTTVGWYAFSGCTNLASVTLSRRTQVGEGAFPENARITYMDTIDDLISDVENMSDAEFFNFLLRMY